jgi:hypothetical protein
VHLLCKHGSDWNQWYALSAGPDAAALQDDADRRNRAEYDEDHGDWLKHGKSGPQPMPLDDPRREGYRTFFVVGVPDWPAVDET